jgi:hypothetical protein
MLELNGAAPRLALNGAARTWALSGVAADRRAASSVGAAEKQEAAALLAEVGLGSRVAAARVAAAVGQEAAGRGAASSGENPIAPRINTGGASRPFFAGRSYFNARISTEPQHRLYFFPLPHGQGSLRAIFIPAFCGKIFRISGSRRSWQKS